MRKGTAGILVSIFGLAAVFWLAYLFFYRFERHLLAYYAWFAAGGSILLWTKKRRKNEVNEKKIKIEYFYLSFFIVFLQSVISALANNEKIIKFLLHDFLVFPPWYLGWYLVLSRYRLQKEIVLPVVAIHAFLFEELYLQPVFWLPLILPMVIAFYWLMFYPVYLLFPVHSPPSHPSRFPPFFRALFLPLFLALLGQVVSGLLAARYPGLFSPRNM